jgi:polar amino acid transport system substrate-binding protein
MKKHLLPLIIVFTLLLVACGGAATPTEAPMEEPEAPMEAMEVVTDLGGQTVRIAVDNGYPPFSFLDEQGNPIGWDYDFWNEVCARLNCEPDYVEATWEGLFEAMSAGEYDMTGDGITLTLARSLRIDYSDPYVEYGQVILVPADDDRFSDQEAWVNSDATVGTQIGTTNEITAMSLVGEERVVSFEEYDLPVVAMLAGDVDSVIIDEVAAVGFMGENPGEMKVAFRATGGEFLALAFPPLSPLVEPVNWAMQEMFADGTMDEICTEWLLRPCSPE